MKITYRISSFVFRRSHFAARRFQTIYDIRYTKYEKGMTLIEALLTVAVIGAGLIGVMYVFAGGASSALIADQTIIASNLAREKIEEVVADRAVSGYASTIAQNYSDSPGGDYSEFTRTVTIAEVNSADLTTPSAGSGYARVSVTVSWGTRSVLLETLIANYP